MFSWLFYVVLLRVVSVGVSVGRLVISFFGALKKTRANRHHIELDGVHSDLPINSNKFANALDQAVAKKKQQQHHQQRKNQTDKQTNKQQ